MENDALIRRRNRAMGPAYSLFYEQPVHLVRGEGVWLHGADGRRYLDCYNNVASVGHCHPRVVAALGEQASRLNTHTRYLHDKVVEYAERLGGTMPGDLEVCMFTCTGTEANDLALRIARSVTGQRGAVVLENAYHGLSEAVFELSTAEYPAADRPVHVEAVAAPNAYRGRFRYGEADHGRRYGELVADAVQSLGGKDMAPALFINDNAYSTNGILTPPPEYLHEAYRQIRAAGGLAVADEVQSGLCRMGENMWAFEDSGVVPDIVTLGKPLGDGHPLAAVVTTTEIAEAFAQKHDYFNTFGGNPVSATVGLTVLDVIEEENILDNVRETGRYLRTGLLELQERFEPVGDVRGKGLFYGIELVRDRETMEPAAKDAEQVREFLRENGVLLSVTGPLGNVLKVRPPMVFSKANADQLLEKLEEALACVS